MALRRLLDLANALIFGHQPELAYGHPWEGKSRDGLKSVLVIYRRGKCTPIEGWPHEEKDMIKGIVVKYPNDQRWCPTGFQMPLHYPRYKKEDYERMEGWKVDMVLREYGLTFQGSLEEKRAYAIGTFLWPDQL